MSIIEKIPIEIKGSQMATECHIKFPKIKSPSNEPEFPINQRLLARKKLEKERALKKSSKTK